MVPPQTPISTPSPCHQATRRSQDLHGGVQAPNGRVDESPHNCVQDEGEDLREGEQSEQKTVWTLTLCPTPVPGPEQQGHWQPSVGSAGQVLNL